MRKVFYSWKYAYMKSSSLNEEKGKRIIAIRHNLSSIFTTGVIWQCTITNAFVLTLSENCQTLLHVTLSKLGPLDYFKFWNDKNNLCVFSFKISLSIDVKRTITLTMIDLITDEYSQELYYRGHMSQLVWRNRRTANI